jgi:hypothetical protein
MAKRKAKPITINDFRLSFIWACTLLTDKLAPIAPFGQRFKYAKLFQEARDGKSKEFSLPWPPEKPYAHRFWAGYLRAGNPSDVDIQDAWDRATPLRSRQAPFTLAADWFTGQIRVEHFFYPFGAALVVTFEVKEPLTEYAWVDRVLDTTQRPFMVNLAGNPAAQQLTLTELAGDSLRRVRSKYFSDAAEPQLPTPFSIVTVIGGSEVNPQAAPPAASKIHRMLYGAATRSPNYVQAALGKLTIGDNLLKRRSQGAADGDLIYATPRGRTIWFPSSFTKVSGKQTPVSSLSCYHRNQCCAAPQAESLCSLAREVAIRLDQAPDNVPNWINEFGKLPAQMLATMYDGDRALTYRSASLPRQIDDNGVKNSVARLRLRHGLPSWPVAQPPPSAVPKPGP